MILYPNVKLNLGLSVLRKRADGYHDLETLFVPYEGICDRLEIEPSASFNIEIKSKAPVQWDPQQDLTAKAWRILNFEYGIPPVSIFLEKNAPVGAGLGGGSSDAVSALKIMNVLFGLQIPVLRMEELALQLGSDCPFFVRNEPMIGEGRGEILTPFEIDLTNYKIKVIVPEGVSVSTREAYGGIVPREKDPDFDGLSLRDALVCPVEQWKDVLVNDFEKTVFAAHPQLAQVKSRLYDEGAVYASMSGSGSSIFGLFPGRESY